MVFKRNWVQMAGRRLMPTVRMMVSHRYGWRSALAATPAREGKKERAVYNVV